MFTLKRLIDICQQTYFALIQLHSSKIEMAVAQRSGLTVNGSLNHYVMTTKVVLSPKPLITMADVLGVSLMLIVFVAWTMGIE